MNKENTEPTKNNKKLIACLAATLTVIIFVVLLVAIIHISNSNKTNKSSSEVNIETYKDDYVEFNYDPNIVMNTQIENANAKYSLLTKLKYDTIDYSVDENENKSLIVNNNILYVIVMDEKNSKNLSTALEFDYKKAFTELVTGLCQSQETISTDDIIGTPETTIRIDKTLSNGVHFRIKVLSLNENEFAFVGCTILPTTKFENSEELSYIYDNIEYLRASKKEIETTDSLTKSNYSKHYNKTKSSDTSNSFDIVYVLILLFILSIPVGLFILLLSKSAKAIKTKESLETKYDAKFSADLKHFDGLPLPVGIAVKVFYGNKKIVFKTSTQEVEINLDKVISIDTSTGKNMKSQATGGAIAGSLIIGGATGALIGSLVATTLYLIITYKNSDDERKFIILDTAMSGSFYSKVIKDFKANHIKEVEKIEL